MSPVHEAYPSLYTFNDCVQTIIDSPLGLERVRLSGKLHQTCHNRGQEWCKGICVEVQALQVAEVDQTRGKYESKVDIRRRIRGY